jgi:hypothetical protein
MPFKKVLDFTSPCLFLYQTKKDVAQGAESLTGEKEKLLDK